MASLEKLFLVPLVFFVFIIGGVLMVHNVESSYSDEGVDMELDQFVGETFKDASGREIDDYTIGNLNGSGELYDVSSSMHNKLITNDIDLGSTEDSMFKGSFSAIRLVTSPISLISNTMNEISISVGIPPIFKILAFTALILTVMFAIIYLVFRVRS